MFELFLFKLKRIVWTLLGFFFHFKLEIEFYEIRTEQKSNGLSWTQSSFASVTVTTPQQAKLNTRLLELINVRPKKITMSKDTWFVECSFTVVTAISMFHMSM